MAGVGSTRGASRNWARPTAIGVALLLVMTMLTLLPETSGATGTSTPTVAPEWSEATIDGGQSLSAVSCPVAGSCTAVDSSGSAVTLSSGAWSSPVSIAPTALASISCPTTTFCAAVDVAGDATVFENGTWQGPTPVDPGAIFVSVSCPSTTFCAAVDSAGGVVTYSAGTWSAPASVDAGYRPTGIACVNATSCTIVDYQGNVVTLIGSVWSTTPNVDTSGFNAVSCPTTTFCIAPDGAGEMATFNGTTWSESGSSSIAYQALSCPTTTFCAADTPAGVRVYSQGNWSGYSQTGNAAWMTGISCASASFCVSVGAGGVAATYDGGTIATNPGVDAYPFTGVSCGSTEFCVAVDEDGGAETFTAPSWNVRQDIDGTVPLSGVSCSASHCVAVDGKGNVTTYQAGQWSAPVAVPGAGALTGVSCPTPSFCMASNALGSVLTFSGGNWSAPADIDGTVRLNAVSCASVSSCMVVDGAGSSLRYDGSTWTSAGSVGDQGIPAASLTCPTSTHCLADEPFNASVSTFDGTTWSSAPIPATDATVVGCGSATSCAAAGPYGLLSFNEGAGWTYPVSPGTMRNATGLACVQDFCAEVDSSGNALIVHDAGPTVTASSTPGSAAGSPVTYSTTVSASWATTAVPTGSVSFATGGLVLCTAALTGGAGSCTSSSAPSGSDTVTATYGGDANHLSGSAPPFQLNVTASPVAPAVTSVSPEDGCAPGGSQLTITGTNLSGASEVDFGSTPSPHITVSGPTSIVATVPAGQGVVDVRVTTPVGSSTPTPADQFSFGPVVTSVTLNAPESTALGGDDVLIGGIELGGATAVHFGSAPAASFSVRHPWQLEAVSPPGAGTFDVTVTGGGCTSPITSSDRYTAWPIVTSISPSTGVTAGGTAVTIVGAGFTGATGVTFGPFAATSYQVVSDNELIAVSPPEPYKESVVVTVLSALGPSFNDSPPFRYDPYPATGPPMITSITPTTARAGSPLTITGTDLGDIATVAFGTVDASISSQTETSLSIVVPDGAVSGGVTVTGTNGTATSSQAFTLTDPSTPLPAGPCTQVLPDPAGARVYVSCGSTVSVFSTTGSLLTTLPGLPGAGPMAVVGGHLYVVMEGSGSVAEIDTTSLDVSQVFAAGVVGATSMAYAHGLLWAFTGASLVGIDPMTGTTSSYSGGYLSDLSHSGLRPDPADPDRLYDIGALSSVDVAASPPTATRRTTFSADGSSISGAQDGVMTPDGTGVLLAGTGIEQFHLTGANTPVVTYGGGGGYVSAVTESQATDGGLVVAGMADDGLTSVMPYSLGAGTPLESVSFGDIDATVPTQCVAISPDGSEVYAVTQTGSLSGQESYTFHAVPLDLPSSAPSFTSSTTAAVVAGQHTTIPITTSGIPAVTVTESGALPPGMTFSSGVDGGATISGTAPVGTSGTYAVQLTATNLMGSTTETLPITVGPVPIISSPSVATFASGTYGYFGIMTSGDTTPTLSESGPLPPGLTFTDDEDGTGSISGTPLPGDSGVYQVTITVDSGVPDASQQTLDVDVDTSPSFTSDATARFTAAKAGSFTVATSAWPHAALSLQSSLPSGLSFKDNGDGTATIAGSPTPGTVGSYQVQIDAANGIGAASGQTLALSISTSPTPIVVVGPVPSATHGVPYGPVQLVGSGGLTPYKWKKTAALPKGLKLSKTGVLSGTPNKKLAPGTYSIAVQITDATPKHHQVATGTLTLSIN